MLLFCSTIGAKHLCNRAAIVLKKKKKRSFQAVCDRRQCRLDLVWKSGKSKKPHEASVSRRPKEGRKYTKRGRNYRRRNGRGVKSQPLIHNASPPAFSPTRSLFFSSD